MSVFHLTRGEDIEIFKNDERLFGVVELKINHESQGYDIREMMNSTPLAHIKTKESFRITLKALSLFHLSFEEPFSLRIIDEEEEMIYHGCQIDKAVRRAEGEKTVTDLFEIRAISVEKRSVEDE